WDRPDNALDDAAECAKARSRSRWGDGAAGLLCVCHAVHVNAGSGAPRNQQLEVAGRPVYLHDHSCVRCGIRGQPGSFHAAPLTNSRECSLGRRLSLRRRRAEPRQTATSLSHQGWWSLETGLAPSPWMWETRQAASLQEMRSLLLL